MTTLSIIFVFISGIAFGQESDPYGFYTGWDTTFSFTNTIYFNPDYSGTETGSYSQPYNHITDVTLADNTDYLFKRGTTMEITSSINPNVGSIDSSNNYRTNAASSTWNSYLSIEDWETSDFTRTSDLNDGVDVGLEYDFNGNSVSDLPERGALEYQSEAVQTNTMLKSGGNLLRYNGKFIK